MTPKEKAQELVDKFYQTTPNEAWINEPLGIAEEYKAWNQAKQCALIAVDEILNEYAHAENHIEDIMGKISIYIKYWQEVKQEIEAL